MFVEIAKVFAELRHGVQVAQELRVEGEHYDAHGDEGGPQDGGGVEGAGLKKG